MNDSSETVSANAGNCSNPPREQQDDEDDDEETGTTADVMIAGTEAIPAATNEQDNEKNEEEIHGGIGGLNLAAFKTKSQVMPEADAAADVTLVKCTAALEVAHASASECPSIHTAHVRKKGGEAVTPLHPELDQNPLLAAA